LIGRGWFIPFRFIFTQMISKERVTDLIEQRIEGTDLFLVKLSISSANAIKVIVDGDSGVSIEQCIAISRQIEHNLDRDEEDFSLEVTSFGLGEALLLHRQYEKNLERNVKINLKDGTRVKGKLLEVEENHIVIDQDLTKKQIKEGKEAHIQLAFDDIQETKVEVSFK
jgi:ribosome maturation factor RimP